MGDQPGYAGVVIFRFIELPVKKRNHERKTQRLAHLPSFFTVRSRGSNVLDKDCTTPNSSVTFNMFAICACLRVHVIQI